MSRKRISLESKAEEILKLHSEGMNSKDIAMKIGGSVTGVCRFLKRRGLKSNNVHSLTPKQKEEIIDRYLKGETIREIHKDYKDICSDGCINLLLRQKGITRRNGVQPILNENYFENIDSEHKAYWVGFILADGCVRHNIEKGNSYSLRVELKYEDGYLLERLVKDLESNKKVKDYRGKSRFKDYEKEKHNAYVDFFSMKLVKDLEKYGVVQRKSTIIENLPNIDEKYMRHFIRGFFDGNGSVFMNTKNQALRISIYSTNKFCTNLRNYLFENVGMNMIKVTDQKKANVSFITYSSVDNIKKFYNYLYDGATIYLNRKYDIFSNNLK